MDTLNGTRTREEERDRNGKQNKQLMFQGLQIKTMYQKMARLKCPFIDNKRV